MKKVTRRPKTERELREAYNEAFNRAEHVQSEIRDRKDGADSDELMEMSDAWDDVRDALQVAREDLEAAGFSVRPGRRKKKSAKVKPEKKVTTRKTKPKKSARKTKLKKSAKAKSEKKVTARKTKPKKPVKAKPEKPAKKVRR